MYFFLPCNAGVSTVKQHLQAVKMMLFLVYVCRRNYFTNINDKYFNAPRKQPVEEALNKKYLFFSVYKHTKTLTCMEMFW